MTDAYNKLAQDFRTIIDELDRSRRQNEERQREAAETLEWARATIEECVLQASAPFKSPL